MPERKNIAGMSAIVRKTDNPVVSLLEDLGTPAEPFLQPFEWERFIAGKREILRELARFQNNPRVYALFARLDADSRTDASWEATVEKSIAYAPITLALVQADTAQEERSKRNYNIARV